MQSSKWLIGVVAAGMLGSCIAWHGPTGDDAYRSTCCQCEEHSPTYSQGKHSSDHSTPSHPQRPSPLPSPTRSKTKTKTPDLNDNPMPGKPTKKPKKDRTTHPKTKKADKRPRQRTTKPNRKKNEKPGT